ncbi:radical SAM/SPASM protein FxsBH, inactivated beta-hydroxylase extension form [Streptomyces microflavus]
MQGPRWSGSPPRWPPQPCTPGSARPSRWSTATASSSCPPSERSGSAGRGSRAPLWCAPTARGSPSTPKGRAAHRARRGEGPHWSPVRVLGGPGLEPVCVRDDLDPYRTCFDTPAADRLGPQAADAWSAALAQAWELLAETVPDQAAEAAAVLTTLTPLAAGEAVQVGRHGYGALGIAAGSDAHDLAPALLRGFRRAKLRALAEVTDLYASDGSWDHRMPWQEEPVPFSRLLSETYERVGLGLFAPRFLAGVPQALDMIEEAAETTVDGKQLLAGMRKEINGTHGTSGRNGCKTDTERAAVR